MAERRMFAKTIVLSDAFLDMPLSARCLYFTLGMFADDDGFVNAPKGIMRQIGCSEDDMRVLLARKFVLAFDSGVIVIKHWRINNYLQRDRYCETKYKEEKAHLKIDENGAYKSDSGCLYTQYVYTQDRLGKDSIVKDRIDKDSIGEDRDIYPTNVIKGEGNKRRFTPPTLPEVREYCRERNNGVDAEKFVDYYQARDWCLSKGVKMKDWRAAVRTWEHRDKPQNENKLSNLERLYREELERNGKM